MDAEMGELVAATDSPDVAELIKKFRSCGTAEGWMDRTRTADDVRFNRWEGQDRSGKKWDVNMAQGKRAFPWDGASDTRTYAADGVVNESFAVNYSAFWRAMLKVQSTSGTGTGAGAGDRN